MVAILIGVIYFGQHLDQDGVMNINGAIFMFLTNMTFQNIFAVINVSILFHFVAFFVICVYFVLVRTCWSFTWVYLNVRRPPPLRSAFGHYVRKDHYRASLRASLRISCLPALEIYYCYLIILTCLTFCLRSHASLWAMKPDCYFFTSLDNSDIKKKFLALISFLLSSVRSS